MRIGALILSISGASAGCITTTCYVPAPTNNFHVDQTVDSSDSIVVRKSISDTITGTISVREGNTFSYVVFDSSKNVVLKDDIQPIDGNFDEDIKKFKIGFGPAILPGKYDLKFYAELKDTIKNADWYGRPFSLTITD